MHYDLRTEALRLAVMRARDAEPYDVTREQQLDQAVREFARIHAAILGVTSPLEVLRFWEKQLEHRLGR